MRRQFRDTILELASQDPGLVLLFGDVSVYLFKEFSDRYPDRFYNLGINENTIVSAAAGLAAVGLAPYCHTIAPFLTERSYEQIKLDLCYNRFPATLVSCGATFDYAWDGATHHSYTDLAILRLLPGLEVYQPGSRRELDALLRARRRSGSPAYFRLSDHPHCEELPVEPGRGVILADKGSRVTVATAGPILANVLPACADLDVNLLYFHTLKPMDRELVAQFAHTHILVVHDAFGLHEAVHEVPGLRTYRHGLRDEFCCTYGTLPDIRASVGLDVQGIREQARRLLASLAAAPHA